MNGKGCNFSPIKISNLSEWNNERSIRPLQISYKSSLSRIRTQINGEIEHFWYCEYIIWLTDYLNNWFVDLVSHQSKPKPFFLWTLTGWLSNFYKKAERHGHVRQCWRTYTCRTVVIKTMWYDVIRTIEKSMASRKRTT